MFKVSLWREDLGIVLAVIVTCLLCSLIFGCGEVETGQIEQETADRVGQVKPEDRLALMTPIHCDATSKQGQHEHLMPFVKERCYQRRTK